MSSTLPAVVGEVGYALRLPPALKHDLELLAKRDHRSLNAEMIFALEQFVKAQQGK